MPLKTNVGVSRKVADNNYGSRGASVNLEVELDSTLINDPERFHDRIRQVFRLAQQAIDEELTRQQGNGTASRSTHGATNNQTAQSFLWQSPYPMDLFRGNSPWNNDLEAFRRFGFMDRSRSLRSRHLLVGLVVVA